MATTRVTPNADEIIAEVRIGAPRQRVFEAITDPKQVIQWWGRRGVYQCTEFQSDLRVGGKWRSSGLDGQGRIFEVAGVYLEVDSPRLLVHTWIASWTGTVQTTVRWELEETSLGTLVRITHSGLSAHPELAQSYQGWPRMLGWLEAFVEKGETIETQGAAPTR